MSLKTGVSIKLGAIFDERSSTIDDVDGSEIFVRLRKSRTIALTRSGSTIGVCLFSFCFSFFLAKNKI